jgi:hypothetical protein
MEVTLLNFRDPERTLGSTYASAIASGIPWTAVFGNHDFEVQYNKLSLCN